MTAEPTRLNFETPTKPSEVLASKQLEQIEADKVIDNFVEIMKNHDFKGCNDNTCLLYTSPSPRDRTRSRMPSSA